MANKISLVQELRRLEIKQKQLEIKEKEQELEYAERKLKNVDKAIIVDQIDTLMRLMESRLIKADGGVTMSSYETKWENAFDDDDVIKIKAKIMRLINTF